MSDTSPRLGLPLLQPGQAQKELTHNAALTLLDMAVQASVVAVGVNDPPTTPAAGQAWIVGAAPAGPWASHAGAIAGWTENGWSFVAPREGMTVWTIADGCDARFSGGAWRVGVVAANRLAIGGIAVVGPQAAEIITPGGGSVVDAEARGAIAAILGALRGHGLIAT